MSNNKYQRVLSPQMEAVVLLSFSQRVQFRKLVNIFGYTPVLVGENLVT